MFVLFALGESSHLSALYDETTEPLVPQLFIDHRAFKRVWARDFVNRQKCRGYD